MTFHFCTAFRLAVGDREARCAVDRDRVVVPKHDELAEPQCTGQRAGLVRNTLHQTAVADKRVGMMGKQLQRGIENMLAVGCQPFSQMDVIGITAEAGPVIGFDPDRAFFYFLKDASIG